MAELETRIAQARGDEPADIVLRGGRVYDLITGEMIAGDVAICGDTIVGVGEDYDGAEIVDVSGLTLVPGFIDTHLHVESSLVTPLRIRPLRHAARHHHRDLRSPRDRQRHRRGGRAVFPGGVGTHADGPARATLVLRAVHGHGDLRRVARRRGDRGADGPPSGIGLAEFMNYPGVIHRDPGAMAKLRLFEGGHVDGHCPLLSGRDLNAYVAAGIRTEHEATSAPEAREKLRKGMRVLIREGSVSKDLEALQPLLTQVHGALTCACAPMTGTRSTSRRRGISTT
jgi:adenine deaminase